MRGSDPEAALYWLAKMLDGGEDPRFIARRMVIFASEDVGLADSRALLVAEAAPTPSTSWACPKPSSTWPMPPSTWPSAPKSNSTTVAIGRAMREVKEGEVATVPIHLRDSSYRGADSSATARVISIPITTPVITWNRPTSPTICAVKASTNRREAARRRPWPTPGAGAPGRNPPRKRPRNHPRNPLCNSRKNPFALTLNRLFDMLNRMYTDTVIDHFKNPRNVGEVDQADGVGEVGNPVCGDMIRISIKVEDGRLAEVKLDLGSRRRWPPALWARRWLSAKPWRRPCTSPTIRWRKPWEGSPPRKCIAPTWRQTVSGPPSRIIYPGRAENRAPEAEREVNPCSE